MEVGTKLTEKVNRIDHNLEVAQQILNNWRTMDTLDPGLSRLVRNNERFFYGQSGCYTGQVLDFGTLDIDEKYQVILGFSRGGELLAEKITKYFDEKFNELGYSHLKLILASSDIPERLLLRTMTEEDYNGYLNGEIPFGEFDDVEHYLS